jgi:hypothetical protein
VKVDSYKIRQLGRSFDPDNSDVNKQISVDIHLEFCTPVVRVDTIYTVGSNPILLLMVNYWERHGNLYYLHYKEYFDWVTRVM